jgi:hypothetical protein
MGAPAEITPEGLTPVQVFRDGNAWCATGPGFTNLQESPAGFGDEVSIAVKSLADQLKVPVESLHALVV